MNLYEAIFVRKSVRSYCFDTLPPQTLDKIWEHYKEMPALFSGIGVDMAILDNRKGQERMLVFEGNCSLKILRQLEYY